MAAPPASELRPAARSHRENRARQRSRRLFGVVRQPNFEARVHQNSRPTSSCRRAVVAFALADACRSTSTRTHRRRKNGPCIEGHLASNEEVAALLHHSTDAAPTRAMPTSRRQPAVGRRARAHRRRLRMGRKSTYIQEPPFFIGKKPRTSPSGRTPLAIFGDSVTTDHISPAGGIKPTSPPASTSPNTACKKPTSTATARAAATTR